MHVPGIEVVELGALAGAGKAGRKAILRTPARSRERDTRDPFAIVAEAFDSDPLVIWQGADAAVMALRKACKHIHGFDTLTVQRIAPAVFAVAAQLTAAVDVLGRLAPHARVRRPCCLCCTPRFSPTRKRHPRWHTACKHLPRCS